mgnify:CR=1 FL=1
MLIRKRINPAGTISFLPQVSILLILDVDSEGLLYSALCSPSSKFQSFLFWMLIRKIDGFSAFYIEVPGFNPSYSGCWFGRTTRKTTTGRKIKFQSFLFWMLIRKVTPAQKALLDYFGFNPSYSGCWFGSRADNRYSRIISYVSILLILDVDSEAPKKLK